VGGTPPSTSDATERKVRSTESNGNHKVREATQGNQNTAPEPLRMHTPQDVGIGGNRKDLDLS